MCHSYTFAEIQAVCHASTFDLAGVALITLHKTDPWLQSAPLQLCMAAAHSRISGYSRATPSMSTGSVQQGFCPG
jgi:hypothetical protein